jgi:hypothetical protein
MLAAVVELHTTVAQGVTAVAAAEETEARDSPPHKGTLTERRVLRTLAAAVEGVQ